MFGQVFDSDWGAGKVSIANEELAGEGGGVGREKVADGRQFAVDLLMCTMIKFKNTRAVKDSRGGSRSDIERTRRTFNSLLFISMHSLRQVSKKSTWSSISSSTVLFVFFSATFPLLSLIPSPVTLAINAFQLGSITSEVQ